MSTFKDEEEEDLSFGSLRRHDAPSHEASELIDKVLGAEDTVSGTPQDIVARGRVGVGEVKPLAVNQATMVCHRGPCIHLWALTSRSGAQIRGWDRIQITRVRQCNAHYEPTDLTESNIFECGLWWPATLSFVPVSLRALLRPRLHQLWNKYLSQHGYDFSWKWWEDNVFEKDALEDRKQPMPSGQPADLYINVEGKP